MFIKDFYTFNESLRSDFDDDFLRDSLKAVYDWFFGALMSETEGALARDTTRAFAGIGEHYHDKKITGNVYRVSQLHTRLKDKEDIMKIKKCRVANKHIQSWATTEDGARWFFEHFVRDQNQSADPEVGKSWVILRTDVSKMHQLLTFEECMDFVEDVQKDERSIYLTQGLDSNEFAAKLLKALKIDEMMKLHEVMCVAPYTLEADVIDVMVPPKKKETLKDWRKTHTYNGEFAEMADI